MQVLNELGARIGDQIRAAVPDVEVIDLGAGPAPAGADRRRAVRRLGPAQLRVRAARPLGAAERHRGRQGAERSCSRAASSPAPGARARCPSPSSCSGRCSRSRSGSRTSGSRAARALELRQARRAVGPDGRDRRPRRHRGRGRRACAPVRDAGARGAPHGRRRARSTGVELHRHRSTPLLEAVGPPRARGAAHSRAPSTSSTRTRSRR